MPPGAWRKQWCTVSRLMQFTPVWIKVAIGLIANTQDGISLCIIIYIGHSLAEFLILNYYLILSIVTKNMINYT